MIRRLDPDKDRGLFVDAFLWDIIAPEWYKSADKVFRPESFEKYLELAHGDDQADIGVFVDNKFVGLVTVSMRAKRVYEGHLSAKRGTSVELLAEAVYQIRRQLFEMGMQEAFVWVAARNRAVKNLCRQAGFYDTNVNMLRGSCRGRVIEWCMFATTRAQWEAESVRLEKVA